MTSDRSKMTFEVSTIKKDHEFRHAVSHNVYYSGDAPTLLQVKDGEGDDIRVFNFEHIIDFAWTI